MKEKKNSVNNYILCTGDSLEITPKDKLSISKPSCSMRSYLRCVNPQNFPTYCFYY